MTVTVIFPLNVIQLILLGKSFSWLFLIPIFIMTWQKECKIVAAKLNVYSISDILRPCIKMCALGLFAYKYQKYSLSIEKQTFTEILKF